MQEHRRGDDVDFRLFQRAFDESGIDVIGEVAQRQGDLPAVAGCDARFASLGFEDDFECRKRHFDQHDAEGFVTLDHLQHGRRDLHLSTDDDRGSGGKSRDTVGRENRQKNVCPIGRHHHQVLLFEILQKMLRMHRRDQRFVDDAFQTGFVFHMDDLAAGESDEIQHRGTVELLFVGDGKAGNVRKGLHAVHLAGERIGDVVDEEGEGFDPLLFERLLPQGDILLHLIEILPLRTENADDGDGKVFGDLHVQIEIDDLLQMQIGVAKTEDEIVVFLKIFEFRDQFFIKLRLLTPREPGFDTVGGKSRRLFIALFHFEDREHRFDIAVDPFVPDDGLENRDTFKFPFENIHQPHRDEKTPGPRLFGYHI